MVRRCMPGIVPGVVLGLFMGLAATGLARPADASEGAGGAAAGARDAIAVIIGNRRYRHGLPEVRYAENDARAAAAFVRDVLGYEDGNVIELLDASQAEMFSVFGNARDHRGKLWSWVRPDRSDVFVFYSGHGVPGLRDKRGYLLPSDADPATPEINGYPLDLLVANLSRLRARSILVLVDACFTGNSDGGWLIESASPVYVRTEAPAAGSGPGMTLITAARNDQLASWDHSSRQGLFTRHVLEALGGRADREFSGDGDGRITLAEVQAYLDEELTYAARRQFGRVQRASVSGMPGSVLVHRVPADSWRPPPVSRDGEPGGPGAGPAPGKPAPGAVVAGRYTLPGKDKMAVERFLDRHAAALRAAIAAFLRDGDTALSEGGVAGLVWLRVVRAGADDFDILVKIDRERGRDARAAPVASYATFSIEVTPDYVRVMEMWR